MRKRHLVLSTFALFIFLSPLVSPQSSDSTTIYEWRMFGRNFNHTRYYPSSVNMANFTMLWNYTTGGDVLSSPAVADGVVYIGSDDYRLYALNASTGSHIWNYSTGNRIDSSPALAYGMAYFGCDNNRVYALNASNGLQMWNYTTGDDVFSSPAVGYGAVFIGSKDRRIYALNAYTGAHLWNYTTSSWVLSSPALAYGMLYLGSNDSRLYALNASTGAHLWNYTTNSGIRYSSPAVADGVVYVGSDDYRVYALNAFNGSEIWSYNTGSTVSSSPAVGDGAVFVGSDASVIYALNASTGDVLWAYIPGGSVSSSPAFAVGNWASHMGFPVGIVYFGSHDNHVYALNATTGEQIWNYTTGDWILYSSPAIVNGAVIIGSTDNRVYAFGPGGGGPTTTTTTTTSTTTSTTTTTTTTSSTTTTTCPGQANFDFYGYAYDTTKNPIEDVNVTLNIYSLGQHGPTLLTFYTDQSDSNGFFNVTNVIGCSNLYYKPYLRHMNLSNADYVGKPLPTFPYQEMARISYPLNFYLWRAATFDVTVFRDDDPSDRNFTYNLEDTKLGYSVDSIGDENEAVTRRIIYAPANRNYSLSVYAYHTFPVSIWINNISSYSNPWHIDLRVNATEDLIWVSGYALAGGSANFDSFHILGYAYQPGDFVADRSLPCNASNWRCSGEGCNYSDIFNKTSGFYNITLPGSASTSNILLFALAKSGSVYYGAYKNLTLRHGNSAVNNFNFTFQVMGGSALEFVNCSAGGVFGVLTRKVVFNFQNSSGYPVDSVNAIFDVDYSSLGSAAFKWRLDADSDDNGTIKVPLLNDSVIVEMFNPKYAPLEKNILSSQFTNPVNISLQRFRPGGINESLNDISIEILTTNSTCDVPNPQGCSLTSSTNLSNFSPFSIVIGGGSMSFRMRKTSSNITVHYRNVDLLASGPPDALFDSSSTTNQSGSNIAEAWRFGSSGPSIYDSVLVGIPYNDSTLDESQDINVLLGKLYDQDWNVVWDVTVNTTDEIPSDYDDFPTQWFNSSSNGVNCSKTNVSYLCYVDTAGNMVWVSIPHFSGLGPDLRGKGLTTTISYPLFTGWNLFGVSVNVSSYNASRTLSLCGCGRVARYANIGDGNALWEEYYTSPVSGGTDFNLSLGSGYFVKCDSNSTLNLTGSTVSSLNSTVYYDWNILAWTNTSGSSNASRVLNSISGAYRIARYANNGVSAVWEEYYSSPVSGGTDFIVNHTQGYFIKTSTNTSWIR